MALARSTPDVWVLGEEAMPEAERALAEELARAWGGDRWDPVRRRYTFATLPREGPPRVPTGRHRELFARYERVNPAWPDGQGLFVLGRIDLGNMARLGGSVLRRALRQLRRRQPQ